MEDTLPCSIRIRRAGRVEEVDILDSLEGRGGDRIDIRTVLTELTVKAANNIACHKLIRDGG